MQVLELGSLSILWNLLVFSLFSDFEPQSKILQSAKIFAYFKPQSKISIIFQSSYIHVATKISFVGENAEFWENMKYEICFFPPPPFFFKFHLAAKRKIKLAWPYRVCTLL